jgi:hypothetical protein
MKHIFPLAFLALVLFGCNEEETQFNEAPAIPPVETMVIDFGSMANNTKSATFERTNWIYSATTVGAWNVIIGTTFAVPVAAFRAAINSQHTVIDNVTWQWEYEVEGFTSQYLARLVGKLQSDEIKWEMYITKKGINGFDEFLWFEGTSKTDGKSGRWELYHSNVFPEKTILIDWKRENETVGEIMYTYVREKNDQREKDNFNGSTLTYGLQEGEFDIYVYVHAWDTQINQFNDTFIEWSRSAYNGHVKSENFFNDNNWHCWDSQGNDVVCN